MLQIQQQQWNMLEGLQEFFRTCRISFSWVRTQFEIVKSLNKMYDLSQRYCLGKNQNIVTVEVNKVKLNSWNDGASSGLSVQKALRIRKKSMTVSTKFERWQWYSKEILVCNGMCTRSCLMDLDILHHAFVYCKLHAIGNILHDYSK